MPNDPEAGENLVFEGEEPGFRVPLTEVPYVEACNRVLFEDERHRVSLREIRAHSEGVVLVLDRVFRRMPGEDQLAYRLALMESYGAGTGDLLNLSGGNLSGGGAETASLECVGAQGDETGNASYAQVEYWCPGNFGSGTLVLSLRETGMADAIEFELRATRLRDAQARVFRVDESALGFPRD